MREVWFALAGMEVLEITMTSLAQVLLLSPLKVSNSWAKKNGRDQRESTDPLKPEGQGTDKDTFIREIINSPKKKFIKKQNILFNFFSRVYAYIKNTP